MGFRRSSGRSFVRGALTGSLVGIFALGLVPSVQAGAGPSSVPEERRDRRGRYLVVFDNDIQRPGDVAAEHEHRYGADVSHVYRHALKGYAAELPDQALEGIARDPRVELVEADRQVEISGQVTPTGVQRIFATANPAAGIDAIDHPRVDVDVAILDTGIDLDHPDLNVVSSTNCTVTGTLRTCLDGAGDDDGGHGSHVAGIVGAIDNEMGAVGVAPGTRLHAVKVLNALGSGHMSWIVAGVDWVMAHADTIEVANMSLGGRCCSDALNRAIATSVDHGVVYAVAAGNRDLNAIDFSPANHPDVLSVSALADFDGSPGAHGRSTCRADEDDTLANFSNWGHVVDIAAPGVCIYSTYAFGLYATVSGTSMASPHVAGAAALLAAGPNDPQSREDVLRIRQTLLDSGNLDWLDESGDGIQEPLLDVSP